MCLIEKRFRLQKQISETDALLCERHVCSVRTSNTTERYQTYLDHLADLFGNVDVAGDVPVHVGLLAERITTHIQEDVDGLRRFK